MTAMRKQSRIALLGALLLGARAWGQQDPGQTSAPTATAPTTPTPAPAFGQEPPPPQVTVAPPVTSLDEASLEPAITPRSYLQPGVHVTESINSNFGNSGSGVVGITRLLGSLDLTRIWSRYTFLADYIGGASIYRGGGNSVSQIHGLAAAQRYAWRTGQVQINDCLTYLPEGAFGFSGFNGAGGGGVSGRVGCGGFGGGGTFGTIGNQSRLTNATSVDLRESLSPRSSITAAGNYTFTTFIGPSGAGTVDSRQESGQVGYSHVLNHFDQVGLQYGYDHFEFPSVLARSVDSQTVQALYEHAISGRMYLILGAGPQFVTLHQAGLPTTTNLSVAARGILRYKFPRSSISLSYIRHTTAGSGIQLGSQTDEARANFAKPLTRLWTGSLDTGYSHHNALLTPPTSGGGSNALGGSYQAGFGGGGLTRRIGRFFSLQMHYQYTYQFFSNSQVRSPDRHIGDITLSWHPAPIRLD